MNVCHMAYANKFVRISVWNHGQPFINQLIHLPTTAVNEVQSMTSVKLLRVWSPGCHRQGVRAQRNEYTPNQWRTEKGWGVQPPPRNSEGTPELCQTEPDL